MFQSCPRSMPAWVLAASLAAACARADYSPLQAGRTWVYAGSGVLEPDSLAFVDGGIQVIQYREVLRLRVVQARSLNGTMRFTVEERDSLFERKTALWRYAPTLTETGSLRDTLIVRTLTYVQDTAMRLERGDSLGFGHHESPDPFFPTVSAAPPGATGLQGLEAPYRGVQASVNYLWGRSKYTYGTAWYLDGIGLYWFRLAYSSSTCGGPGVRELTLQSFDGTAVDPGLAPPGQPLAKAGKIACGIRRAGSRPGLAVAYAIRAGAAEIDAMGRRSGVSGNVPARESRAP